ncbi:DUF2946 domain-containing protein [Xenorhabdus khoisanae]|uniref:DUF2946 domain-containing protein n=1 Tax=Xenorhabdus khoisanae TaxID=880157 RepID=UPI002358BBC8|nr:DUF2946 domain-containing protein [Xenorhabdus khoisanae]MDC9614832.1 DUF2946 domain-containing protein [Xenorhabdus khoisanae]
MLSLFHLSQRRTPAFIALLAILMLFIAPVVSKTLEHHRDDIKSEMNHSMSMPDMQNSSYHQTAPSSHSMNHHGADHIHMGLMDDIACGYCQLLINLPLLAGGFIPFILMMLTVSRAPPAPRFTGPIIRLFYGESQPRAPPLN